MLLDQLPQRPSAHTRHSAPMSSFTSGGPQAAQGMPACYCMANEQPQPDGEDGPLEQRIRDAFRTSVAAREKSRRLRQTTDAVINESQQALERAKILQQQALLRTPDDHH